MASLAILTTISLTISLAMSFTSTPSMACIDDSDCTSLGHKYACYLYQCINWLDKDTGMQHCAGDEQCGHASTCYRYNYWICRYSSSAHLQASQPS